MKNKFLAVRISVLILCCAMIFSGCGKTDETSSTSEPSDVSSDLFLDDTSSDNTSGSSENDGSSDTQTTGSSASSTTDITSEVASQMQGTIDLKGKTLTMLIPAEDAELAKRYEEFCNGKIEFITAQYSDMKNVLATRVMSNQAPDIYYVTNQDYPTVLYRDLLQPLNDKIDFDSSLWSAIKPTVEQFKWTDGNIYFIGEFELGNSFWYNKKVFADAGVSETPETLMAKNQWNWNTFLDLLKEVSDVDNGIYGFGTESNFCYACLASAGEDIVYMDGQKGLINNVNSSAVAEAMDFMQKAYDKRYTYPGGGYTLFSQGKMAMFYGYSGHGSDKNFMKQLDTGNYAFALFPKKPGASGAKYNVPGTITGYGIPKGAKNLDCALAFLIMNRVDTAYKNQLNQAYVKEHGLDNTNFLDIYKQYYQQNFIPMISLGVDKLTQIYWPAESKVRAGTPWTSLREQLSPQVDNAIKALQQ